MKLYENAHWKQLNTWLKNKKILGTIALGLAGVVLGIILLSAKEPEEVINDKDFSLGVLALNTDKTLYKQGDTVMFQMASLDSSGDTLCNSNLQLEIYVPRQKTPLLLTSKDKQIITTATCGENNVTNDPDYISRYTPTVSGEYKIRLTNLDTQKKVISKFKVQPKDIDFQISRYSATRINPFKSDRYPMVITVQATKDYKGVLEEFIPTNFEVMWQGTAKISKGKDVQKLTWDLDLKAGESKNFTYEYKAPLVSPDFIRLGNAQITNSLGVKVFAETAQWQIASDFSCQSNTASGNWSAAGSWTNCNSTTPQAADSVTILNGHTITLDTSPSILAVDIQNGGTLSADANSRVLTLTDTASFVPFTKGATGTFNANNSTVVLASATAGTLTSGTITFNNLTISPTILANRIQSFGSGAITINGNFTINPTAASALSLTVNMGADITLATTGTTTITRTTSATAILDVRPSSTDYNLSTGYLNIATGGTLDCTSSSATITLKGTSGTLFTRVGTFTQGTSTVQVTSASGTPTILSAATTFHKLTINSTATVINAGFTITINNVSGAALDITAGVLNDSGLGITGPGSGNGTLSIGATGVLCLGGSTSAATTATCDSSAVSTTTRSMPTFQTYSFNAASTVIYLSNANTTVSSTPTYGNLRLMPLQTTTARTYTLGANLNINGDFDIFPSNGATQRRLAVNAGGAITIAATGTLKVRANAGTTPASIFSTTATNYALTAGKIDLQSTGSLQANASTITLNATSGTLFTRAGVFVQGTSTINVTSASGPVTLLSANTTLYNLTINSASSSTVINGSGRPTIAASGTLTITSGVMNFDGGVTGPGVGSGTLSIAANGTMCLGGTAAGTNTSTTCNSGATTISAISMPTFQTYSLNASSKVIYLSNGFINVSSTPAYGNLYLYPVLDAGIGDIGYTITAGAMTVNGDFDINPSGSANRLTVSMGGNITVATTKTTYIRSTGGSATSTLDTVANTNALSTGFLNIGTSGTLNAITTSSFTLTGVSGTLFTNNGTFTQATSTVNVTSASGTPSLMGGSSTTTFHILTINSAATVINAGGNFTINNASGAALNVTSGVFNAEGRTITGPGSGNGTFTIGASGTFCAGGTTGSTTATCDSGATQTSAFTVPTFQTYTFNTTSVFTYLADAAQNILSTTYGYLGLKPIITANRIYTFSGTANVSSNFNIIPTAATSQTLTVNMGGTITVAATGTTTITGVTSASAVLDTTSANNYSLSTGLLSIAAGGTLTANNSNITLTGTSGTLFTLIGTFTAGGSTVIYNPDASPTSLTSGAITFNNLSLTPSISSAGRTYTFGAGTLTINGNFTIQPTGTQLLTVNMAGNITVAATGTTSITRSSSATSSLVPGASNPAFSSGIINIATGGILDGTGSSSTITATANGASFIATGTFTPGSTTVAYVPVSTSGVTVGNATYHNVTFNKASNTFSLTTGGITTDSGGVLTISAGVLDAVSGSNYPITVGGNWVNSVGTGGFLAQNGIVEFNQSTTASITGTTTFYNFTSAVAGKTIQFEAGTTFTINGLFTITGSASGPSYVTLTSTTGSTSWTINHQGTESISYASLSWGACDAGSTSIAVNDETSVDGGHNGTCWAFPSAPTYPTPHTSLPIHRLKWYFDEGQSGSVGDNGAQKNTGTITNATWQVTSANQDSSKRSTYLHFDGTGDYVSRASDVDFDFGSASFAVTGWFRHPVAISGTQTILSRATSVNGVGYKVYMDSSGHICFGIDAVAGSFPNDSACTTQTYLDSTWHHFAAIKTSTTSISIYVDGHLGATTSGITSGSLSGTAGLYVGTDVDGSTNGWNGDIDNISIYPDVLTESQINADMLDPSSALFGANSTDPLTNGLIGWWKMDEKTGTTASDSSGNGLTTATFGGGTTWGLGRFGTALSFDGTGDYAYVTDPGSNSALDVTTAFTVNFWMYGNDIADGNYHILLAKGDTDIDANNTYACWLSGSFGSSIYCTIGDGSTHVTDSITGFSATTWYMVTYTFDSRQNATNLYLNGVRQSGGVPDFIPLANNNRLSIGGKSDGSYSFNGLLDDVRIYNHALSPREVAALYNYAPGPIGWWKLDDNKDTTPNDSSGNGNDCTMNSMPTQPWVAGKYGPALKFDGTNDENDCGSPTILDDIAPMSLSVWIKPSTPPSGWGQILSKSTNDTPIDGWMLQLDSSNVLSLIISFDNNGTNVSRSSNSSSVTNGVWSHIEATWDGTVNSTGIRLYVNGQEVVYNGGSTATGVKTTDASVNFTMGNENSLANDYVGLIDDVRVYNYVRTPTQVIQDMGGGHPLGNLGGNEQTAHWKLDEQRGQTINNSITYNTFTTTLGTTGSAESSDPLWLQETGCKINGCLNFDGTDDVLTITNTPSIDFDVGLHAGFTFAAWIYPETAGEGSGGRIFYKGATTWLRVDTLASGKLDIEASLDLVTTDATLNVATAVTQNAWNHVAMSYTDDSDDEITIWVNGKAIGTSTNGVGSLEVDSDDLLIGGDTSNNFDGKIDDFKIYHIELGSTDMEVEAGGNTSASMGGNLGTHDNEGLGGSGPVGWWKLDENTGTTAYDSSGNNYTGTIGGASSNKWTSGINGAGINLTTAGSDRLDLSANISSLRTISTGTFEMWFKSSTVGYIFGLGSAGAWPHLVAYIGDYTGGYADESLCLQFSDNTNVNRLFGCYRAGHTFLYDNAWHHLAYTVNNDGTGNRLYIDGAAAPMSYLNGSISTEGYFINDASMTTFDIGNTVVSGAYQGAITGKIDDVRLYNYARTPAQIAYDYSHGKPIAWYKMDECTGSTIYNAATNANGTQRTGIDGTISLGSSGSQTTGTGVGTCTSNAQTPRYNGRVGKYTSSINFDGVDDYITITNSDAIDQDTSLSSGMSISTWIYANSDGEGDVGRIFTKNNTWCRTDSQSGNNLDIQCNMDLNTDATLNISSAITTGTWNHIVMTWTDDADDEMSIYINGKYRGTSTDGVGPTSSDAANLFIGNDSSSATTTFDGKIDQFQIFTYELNTTQIAKLYNEGAAVRFGD